MTLPPGLLDEPWRFDLFGLLRRLERSEPDRPRIGQERTAAEMIVRLVQEPFLEFSPSTIARADRDRAGRLRLAVRFLGMFGPQGPLPLAVTEEAFSWCRERDDAFGRFVDIIQSRFLELFFRAWADARPIAQRDRPGEDRFRLYLGAMIGVGSMPYRDSGAVPDEAKLAFAGLMAPRVRSASRLQDMLEGLLGVRVEVNEFVGTWLSVPETGRTQLGAILARLGAETMLGGSAYSVQDKIRIRIHVGSMAEYSRFLPEGDLAPLLTDAVFLYLGDEIDWDVELAAPASEIKPARLDGSVAIGLSAWMAPPGAADGVRADARFHLAARAAELRRAKEGSGDGGYQH